MPTKRYNKKRGPASITYGTMCSVLGYAYLNHLDHSPYHSNGTQICINLPEELANGVVHTVVKETLTQYHKIIKVAELKEV